jgi:hypothetical protein
LEVLSLGPEYESHQMKFFNFCTDFRSVSVSTQGRIAESRPNPRIEMFLSKYLDTERWSLLMIRDPLKEFVVLRPFLDHEKPDLTYSPGPAQAGPERGPE